jgi:HNH endonuclease
MLDTWQSFWAKVDKGPFCWNWTAYKTDEGYGTFRSKLAHRVSYAMCLGGIPEGKILHHVCENPCCVNPSHLLPVTDSTHPGNTIDRKRKQTHCKRGHEFTPENTMRYQVGHRRCRACHNQIYQKRKVQVSIYA